jgi:hypothetical protein
MTQLGQILPFRPRQPNVHRLPNRQALAILTEAERLVDLVSKDIQAGICNAGEGIATARLGALADGHTLTKAVMLTHELMALRQQAGEARPADAALQNAIAEWLWQRGNGNG